eukprot:CAMPEP_0204357590 /NCGR_PEP_ID=MMETSP0469-20131031/35850_1 /ASSEMBLY_ACC=CAM_ASM_000384 /TAXON_ID=2969 /ORGANISM="Oxyrrhis marina" /LENGTH=160 /DNA_ID=CAMNT_0051345265 /DNA_START=25 /DNA_END=509 /DNA_ORIENTATION=-
MIVPYTNLATIPEEPVATTSPSSGSPPRTPLRRPGELRRPPPLQLHGRRQREEKQTEERGEAVAAERLTTGPQKEKSSSSFIRKWVMQNTWCPLPEPSPFMAAVQRRHPPPGFGCSDTAGGGSAAVLGPQRKERKLRDMSGRLTFGVYDTRPRPGPSSSL